MKAVTIESNGILAIREHPNPEAGVGEVLVRIHAAGVNNGDLGQLAGLYPAPSGSAPDIPGLELAGEVVAIGPSATRFAVRDRVMAIVGAATRSGGWAPPKSSIRPKPRRVAHTM